MLNWIYAIRGGAWGSILHFALLRLAGPHKIHHNHRHVARYVCGRPGFDGGGGGTLGPSPAEGRRRVHHGRGSPPVRSRVYVVNTALPNVFTGGHTCRYHNLRWQVDSCQFSGQSHSNGSYQHLQLAAGGNAHGEQLANLAGVSAIGLWVSSVVTTPGTMAEVYPIADLRSPGG